MGGKAPSKGRNVMSGGRQKYCLLPYLYYVRINTKMSRIYCIQLKTMCVGLLLKRNVDKKETCIEYDTIIAIRWRGLKRVKGRY